MMFLGKQSSVKRHCAALCLQNRCFLLFICFFIIHVLYFFFSRLLQHCISCNVSADIEHLCKKDIQEAPRTDVEIPSKKQKETDGVDTRNKIEHLCRQDSPKRRLIDKIDQIERMTDEKFKAVFDAFRRTTGMSQRHNDEREELRGEVQERFNEHEEFIRKYFELVTSSGLRRVTVSQKHTQC